MHKKYHEGDNRSLNIIMTPSTERRKALTVNIFVFLVKKQLNLYSALYISSLSLKRSDMTRV